MFVLLLLFCFSVRHHYNKLLVVRRTTKLLNRCNPGCQELETKWNTDVLSQDPEHVNLGHTQQLQTSGDVTRRPGPKQQHQWSPLALQHHPKHCGCRRAVKTQDRFFPFESQNTPGAIQEQPMSETVELHAATADSLVSLVRLQKPKIPSSYAIRLMGRTGFGWSG